MFKKILVPLDGSKMAEAALPAVAVIADKFHSDVTLLHAIEKDAPGQIHGQPHLRDPFSAREYLEEKARGLSSAGISVKIHVHTAEVDNVAGSILDHAQELAHDSIIMCSHGHGRALHLFLGSIAQKIVALGSVPVLITLPGKEGEVPKFSCKMLLLPLDDNPEHALALPVSRELARTCGAAIHLIRVIPSLANLSGSEAVKGRFMPGSTIRLLEMSVDAAEDFLHACVEELHRDGFEAQAHVLRGHPPDVIVRQAERLNIDLIVLATHGTWGMSAFWEGSVTHRVCSQSIVPLLLIPIKKTTHHNVLPQL